MNKRDHIQNLYEIVQLLIQAKKHLEYSFKRCKKIDLASKHTEEQLIEFEALTSRFVRLVDMLIHKFFRSLDYVELIDGGTLIDVVNRAEKRGLIESALDFRAFKDLRNDIAHEYIAEKLSQLHGEVYSQVPYLLEIVQRSIDYSQKYL